MSEWKLAFPTELTEEEKALNEKYAVLRRLKEGLKSLEKTRKDIESIRRGSFEGTSQDQLKEAAGKILKAQEELKSVQENKTSGFKRPTKQNESRQGIQMKSVMPGYAPEVDHLPRSVIVRGKNLERQLLLNCFTMYGDICKIKVGSDHESALIVYKSSESAQKAVYSYQTKRPTENDELIVEMAKKRNSSWVDIAVQEATMYKDATNREKNTVHISYHGHLLLQDFRRIFRSVGTVENVCIPPQSSATTSTAELKPRFAFVTFQNETEAQRAVDEVNGQVYNEITLTVSHQKTSKDYDTLPSKFEKEASNSRELITFDQMDAE